MPQKLRWESFRDGLINGVNEIQQRTKRIKIERFVVLEITVDN